MNKNVVTITLYLKVFDSSLCENDLGYEYVKISTEYTVQNDSILSVIQNQISDVALMYNVTIDKVKTVTEQEYESNQKGKGGKAS